MFSSKLFIIILFSLTLALILKTSFADIPLFYDCSTSGNFTAHSPYESNLKTLTDELILKTPLTGFSVAIAGQYPNQVHGLALCRGDIPTLICNHCVSEATKIIPTLCPNNKGAIIWYDYCMLKYSDTDFFGNIDNNYTFCRKNMLNISDPATLNNETTELLSQLAQKASLCPNYFATGELKLEKSEKLYGKILYGVTQCTRDLSSSACHKCLDDAINDIPNCCYGKKGGRVGSGSCNLRFEIYPFIKK